MMSRVTHQTMMQSAQGNLQSSKAELARLQDTASSQKAIARPSDNPAGTADAMRVRAEARANEQYGRNINNGNGWLTAADAALSTTTDLMNKVRDLTVRGANDGSLSGPAKEAIAVELEGLKADLLNQANTRYLGRSIFAGTSDKAEVFKVTGQEPEAAPKYAYLGIEGSTVERRIGPDSTVRVDTNGSAVYGSGDESVFKLIDDIVADLRTGTNVGDRLGAIDERMSAIRGAHGDIGIRHAQILRAEETNMEQAGSLEARRSEIEDIDLGQVILDLKLQEVAYQSALSVTARVLQPTLMDFLR